MMNSFKNGLQFLAALVMLAVIVFMVWYVMFYIQGPEISSDGTLVYRGNETMVCQDEEMAEERGRLVIS